MVNKIIDFLIMNIVGLIPVVFSLLTIFSRSYLSEFRTELDSIMETKTSRLKADYGRALLMGFLITLSVFFVVMNDYNLSFSLGYVFLIIVGGTFAFLLQILIRTYLLMSRERVGKKKKIFNRVIKLIASFNFLVWFLAVFLFAVIIDYRKLDNPEVVILILSLFLLNTFFIIISMIIATSSTTTRLKFKIYNIQPDKIDEELKELYIVVFLDGERVLMSKKEEENVYLGSKPYYIYYPASHRLQNIYIDRGARMKNIN